MRADPVSVHLGPPDSRHRFSFLPYQHSERSRVVVTAALNEVEGARALPQGRLVQDSYLIGGYPDRFIIQQRASGWLRCCWWSQAGQEPPSFHSLSHTHTLLLPPWGVRTRRQTREKQSAPWWDPVAGEDCSLLGREKPLIAPQRRRRRGETLISTGGPPS